MAEAKEVCYVCGKTKKEVGLAPWKYFQTYHNHKFCPNCYKKEIYICPCCGGRFWDKETPRSKKKVDGYFCCPQCAKHLKKCSKCKKLHFAFNQEDKEKPNYCDTCFNRSIDGYHHAQTSYPFYAVNKDGKNYKTKRNCYEGKFLGLELEMEFNSKPNQRFYKYALLEILETARNEVYFETDGSLHNNGAELITYPHTIDAMYNIDWKELLKIARTSGGISHNTGRCGLHLHFNKKFFGENTSTQTENIAKILVFYSLWWKDLVRFSRRDSEQLHWAEKFDLTNERGDKTKPEVKKSIEASAKNIAGGRHYSRYQAVNLATGRDTIEFRLMRGTLNYDTFMATLDFSINLVKKSTELSWEDVWDLNNWLKDLAENTTKYMAKRKCFGYSNTTTTETTTTINNEEEGEV